jgi:hypothetical protein
VGKVPLNRQIHIKHVCDFDMTYLDWKDDPLIVLAIVLQELGAVLFNLVCGSRLGDHDYFYNVTSTDSSSIYTKSADASYISNASLSSMFVLFLTLHVFRGPYLNFWLVSLDYICVKTETPSDENPKILNGFTKFARLTFIFVAHLVAVGVACAFIPEVRKNSKSTLMWPEIESGTRDNLDGGYIFLEEVVAVCSLLVGFLYLAWLKKYKDKTTPLEDVDPPQVDIEFYIRLTFVVVACKRAFPTAHLSPHVSTYMWWSGQIGPSEWAAHFFAGVIASGVVVFWDKQIRHWFNDQSKASKTSDGEMTPLREKYQISDADLERVNWPVAPKPPNTNTRPGTAPPGGRRPENQDCSLSISFAKPGIYY